MDVTICNSTGPLSFVPELEAEPSEGELAALQDIEAEGWCGKDEIEPLQVSLLELVEAVSDVASGENEVIATVAHMIRSGSVILDGMGSDDGLADLLTAAG
jgi:hypothetical protein